MRFPRFSGALIFNTGRVNNEQRAEFHHEVDRIFQDIASDHKSVQKQHSVLPTWTIVHHADSDADDLLSYKATAQRQGIPFMEIPEIVTDHLSVMGIADILSLYLREGKQFAKYAIQYLVDSGAIPTHHLMEDKEVWEPDYLSFESVSSEQGRPQPEQTENEPPVMDPSDPWLKQFFNDLHTLLKP